MQYVGKAEISFDILLNNHRKDISDPNAILVFRHFTQNGHNSNFQAKSTLIETITDRSKPLEIVKELLR